MKFRKISFLAIAGFSIAAFTGAAFGAPTPDLSQTINSGTLTTDILDGSRNSVVSPSFSLPAQNFSFDCQTSTASGASGLGTSTQRLYVTNPDAAANGWTLTLAATSGSTSTWSGSSFDFNDPNTSGCEDGADTDALAGQMTVDASAGTLTTDCASGCTTGNISLGSSASFEEGVTDSITLLNAASSSDDIWRGYLSGATLSQTIPPETQAGTFTINLTLTATAS